MTDTPNRPPLWLAMDDAIEDAGQNMLTVASSAAAIRAVRDWLIQQCRNEGIDQDARNSIYGMLTAEADRAERAE